MFSPFRYFFGTSFPSPRTRRTASNAGENGLSWRARRGRYQRTTYNRSYMNSGHKCASNTSLIQFLCGSPNPHTWRFVGSFCLAFPIACAMLGFADKTSLPASIVFFLSPGYVIGELAVAHVHDFGRSLAVFGWTGVSVNLIYFAAILYGLLLLRAKGKR